MSKKDIKKKVLQYYVSQQDSYKKEKTLLSFLQLLIMNHTKKISFALLIVAFSIFSFSSPTDAAPMNKEILDYLRVHQNDKNQKKVEKWLSSIIQKYNKEEKWGRIVTGGFAKAVLWSSIINTWDILSWKINIITGATIQTIQWSAINVKDLQLIEIKK